MTDLELPGLTKPRGNTSLRMQSVEATDILSERAFPGDRHRQEQRIETSIVEPFADVVAR